ncbi:NACHT domain-containing protein [Kitasatospora viridis]
MVELADTLRQLMVQRNLTVEQLARRSALGRTTVSQALNGAKLPSERTVIVLATALRAEQGPLLELRRRAAGPAPAVATRGEFERRYCDYLVKRHSHLDIIGLDLSHPERSRWPLDTAYLSLELASPAARSPQETQVHLVQRAEQALAGKQRILVRGQAGSGKTTLLQWLTVAAAQDQLPDELSRLRGVVPFLLPLRRLVRSTAFPTADELLQSIGCPLAGSQPPDWADRVLADGRGMLLLDGLDEVPQRDRDRTFEWLSDLLAAYPACFVAVTTRPSALAEGALVRDRFAELTVRPMSLRDVAVFVERWHDAARAETDDPAEADRLTQLERQLGDTVTAQRDLAQLTTTPLLCALVCALHRDRRGHLPRGRKALYSAALSMLMIRRDDERDITAPEGIVLDEEQTTELLQRLAYWMIRNGLAEAELPDATHAVAAALPAMPDVSTQGDAGQVLTHLIARSGLLRQPTAETVDFIHRTFQDFLGAKAAVTGLDFGVLNEHATDPQWEDVLRMAVAHARPDEAARVLRMLIERGDANADHLTRLHLLAAACLEQVSVLDPTVRAEVEDRLREHLPPRSSYAVDRLSACGPLVLDLLPGPEDLTDIERCFVVDTAARAGGELAMPFLKRFRSLTGVALWNALGRAWASPRIDPAEYAREILSHGSGQGLLTVSGPEHLAALPMAATFSRIEFTGPFEAADLIATGRLHDCQELRLSGGDFESLRFLREHQRITNLALLGCVVREGLGPIGELPLERLMLQGTPIASHEPLAQLQGLRHLTLDVPLRCATLRTLPAPDDLVSLTLWKKALLTTEITGISRWAELRAVALDYDGSQPLDELALLPALDVLSLWCPGRPQLPRLPYLTHLLVGGDSDPGFLEELPSLTPQLRRLTINYLPHPPQLDLAPLRLLPALESVTVYGPTTLLNTDQFPPGTVIHYW